MTRINETAASPEVRASSHPGAGADDAPEVEVAGNRIELFVESQPLIEAMVEAIRSAKTRVWLESYIFADDDAGRAIQAALIDRASHGVDVRVMYDAVGSLTTPNAFFEAMETAGAEVHAYNTLWKAIRRWSLFKIFNRRNHRKLLVIDDDLAFFGGMNIIDQRGLENVEDVRLRGLPRSAGWRDVHVKMHGPATKQVALCMDSLWHWVRHEKVKGWAHWQMREAAACRDEGIFLFDCRPKFRHHRATKIFTSLIKRAKKSVTISMAYFIPVPSVLRAMKKAKKRGVTIRVVVPGESDVKAVEWAMRHYYDRLLKAGIEIHERDHHMLHSKAMVIDDEWSLIGSCNLDPRSLFINLEFVGVLRSKQLADRVRTICEYEMSHSRLVRKEDLAKQTAFQRFRGQVAWWFRRML